MSQRPVPPRGMRDLLPAEVRGRRWILERLLGVYERYGFEQIETPALEEIDRLLDSEGGDNDKLIYKVLKRGLSFDQPVSSEDEVVDLGLRYDLTVPLARFYATHSGELLTPFRSIQAGPVWRAERPQKGRYRQFVQCDIDVLGDAGVGAEIELVCATAEALEAVEVGAFTIRINDRRLLQQMVSVAGFPEAQAPAVLIVIDKLDKIGLDAVAGELRALGDEAAVHSMEKMLSTLTGERGFDAVASALSGADVDAPLNDLRSIVDGARAVLPAVAVEVDATLVRGQGYYTGSIFEVEHDELSGSLAGGGRYDRMIGKLSGVDVPAVGFSIGFERLFDILSSRRRSKDGQRRVVLLHRPDADVVAVVTAAAALRAAGDVVRPERSAKNRGNQLTRLEGAGFTHWAEYTDDSDLNVQPFAKEGSR